MSRAPELPLHPHLANSDHRCMTIPAIARSRDVEKADAAGERKVQSSDNRLPFGFVHPPRILHKSSQQKSRCRFDTIKKPPFSTAVQVRAGDGSPRLDQKSSRSGFGRLFA